MQETMKGNVPPPNLDSLPPRYSFTMTSQPLKLSLQKKPVASSSYPVDPDVNRYPYYHEDRRKPEVLSKMQTVVSEQGTKVIFGPNPTTLHCIICNQTVTTKVVDEAVRGKNDRTFFLYTCAHRLCLPCGYHNVCRAFNHYCSNCNAYQGSA